MQMNLLFHTLVRVEDRKTISKLDLYLNPHYVLNSVNTRHVDNCFLKIKKKIHKSQLIYKTLSSALDT